MEWFIIISQLDFDSLTNQFYNSSLYIIFVIQWVYYYYLVLFMEYTRLVLRNFFYVWFLVMGIQYMRLGMRLFWFSHGSMSLVAIYHGVIAVSIIHHGHL